MTHTLQKHIPHVAKITRGPTLQTLQTLVSCCALAQIPPHADFIADGTLNFKPDRAAESLTPEG